MRSHFLNSEMEKQIKRNEEFFEKVKKAVVERLDKNPKTSFFVVAILLLLACDNSEELIPPIPPGCDVGTVITFTFENLTNNLIKLFNPEEGIIDSVVTVEIRGVVLDSLLVTYSN